MVPRKRNRLKKYDYSQEGFYFITICTKSREIFFGEIKGDEMFLNNHGEIATECWLEIPKHFRNILLDSFIIMPNHMHGVLVISETFVADAYMRPLQINRTKSTLSKVIQQYKASTTRNIRL